MIKTSGFWKHLDVWHWETLPEPHLLFCLVHAPAWIIPELKTGSNRRQSNPSLRKAKVSPPSITTGVGLSRLWLGPTGLVWELEVRGATKRDDQRGSGWMSPQRSRSGRRVQNSELRKRQEAKAGWEEGLWGGGGVDPENPCWGPAWDGQLEKALSVT